MICCTFLWIVITSWTILVIHLKICLMEIISQSPTLWWRSGWIGHQPLVLVAICWENDSERVNEKEDAFQIIFENKGEINYPAGIQWHFLICVGHVPTSLPACVQTVAMHFVLISLTVWKISVVWRVTVNAIRKTGPYVMRTLAR